MHEADLVIKIWTFARRFVRRKLLSEFVSKQQYTNARHIFYPPRQNHFLALKFRAQAVFNML